MQKPVFFVSEREYPKLQAACPDDFPWKYQEFVERFQSLLRHDPSIIKINVRVADFLDWCNKTKVNPNNTSRARYAALLFAK